MDVSPYPQLQCFRGEAVVGALLRDGTAGVRQRRHLQWLWKIFPIVSRFPSSWNVLVMLLEVQMDSWTPGERAGGLGRDAVREQGSHCPTST